MRKLTVEVPLAFKSMDIITGELSDLEYAKRALNKKLSEDYSTKYKMMLKQAFKMLVDCV